MLQLEPFDLSSQQIPIIEQNSKAKGEAAWNFVMKPVWVLSKFLLKRFADVS